MTSAATSPVRRLMLATVYDRGRARQVVVTLDGATVRFRLLGTRTEYPQDARTLFMRALRDHAAEQKRLKKAEREQRRKERS